MKLVASAPKKIKTRIVFSVALLLVFVLPSPFAIFAQVMQSTTYKISTDSINVGGMESGSTSYGLNDTLGEVGTGYSTSTNYGIHAGYWQMQDSYISITSPSDLALDSISGLTGGGSEGVVSWTVTTDNPAGYTMTAEASTSPALKSPDDSFADYTPAGADPDYTFSISSSTSAFGFSPEGTDTDARFKDDSSACNTGTGETSGKCWDGFSTTPKTIAGKSSPNHPAGSSVGIRFRVESGASHIQTSGSYAAYITVTAVTL